MNLLYFFLNSNIYIALAAVSLTLETQVQLGMKLEMHPYLFIIFFATLFEYNLHRLITVITNKEALQDKKHKWVSNNLILFYILVGASVLGFSIAILLAKKEVLITLAPIAILTLFYTLPFSRRNKAFLRLRDIPALKIFLIAFVWSAATIFLPIIQTGFNYNGGHVAMMFMERFLFVFAITIPFDIRDMNADKQAGLKTIPLLIGVKNSLTISNICVVLFLAVCIFHYPIMDMSFLLPAYILSAFTTWLFLRNKRLQDLPYYHYAILDGAILLQGLLVCSVQFLK